MERKYLPEFSFYHTYFPFNEPIYHISGFSNYEEFEEYINKIPRKIYQQCIEWAENFEKEFKEDENGHFTFSSQKVRAKIDREYIRLAEILAEEGLEFKLSIWW
ncbi:hypothetical protein ACN082_06380 [Rothia sp. CCM 9417]|uniref:hypothetical protein n=1 Tax=Rothia sp. CCM 9417 TaxID=3402657 RepID=UPI003ADAD7E4